MTPHRAPRASNCTTTHFQIRLVSETTDQLIGHAGLASAQPGHKGAQKSPFPASPSQRVFPVPKTLSSHFLTLMVTTPSPIPQLCLGKAQAQRRVRKTMALTSSDSVPLPTRPSYTLRVAQALVAVRKWGLSLSQEQEARARGLRTRIPRRMLIGCSAGCTLFPGSRLMSALCSLGGT